MKLLWQAIRAATVDTLGVVLVVWSILGLPLFSYHCLHGRAAAGDATRVTWLSSSRVLPRTTAWPHSLERPAAGPTVKAPHGMLPHAAVWVVSARDWMP